MSLIVNFILVISLFDKIVLQGIHKFQTSKVVDLENLNVVFFKHNLAILIAHIAEMFNYIFSHRFSFSWTSNIIHPIYKVGNPLNLSNFKKIIVSHILTKDFVITHDEFITNFAKTHNLCAPSQVGIYRNYRTIDHILTLQATIEEAQANKWKVYFYFVDFHKAFDSIPRHLLFQSRKNLGTPRDVIPLVMTLYEQVVDQV